MSTVVVLAGVAAMLAGQSLWITRALDDLARRVGRVELLLEALDARQQAQGERVARLEGRS